MTYSQAVCLFAGIWMSLCFDLQRRLFCWFCRFNFCFFSIGIFFPLDKAQRIWLKFATLLKCEPDQKLIGFWAFLPLSCLISADSGLLLSFLDHFTKYLLGNNEVGWAGQWKPVEKMSVCRSGAWLLWCCTTLNQTYKVINSYLMSLYPALCWCW